MKRNATPAEKALAKLARETPRSQVARMPRVQQEAIAALCLNPRFETSIDCAGSGVTLLPLVP